MVIRKFMTNLKLLFCKHNYIEDRLEKRVISIWPYMRTWDRVEKCTKCGKEKIV